MSVSPPESARSLVGQVLSDRYRLDALIAAGSMGSVYRGMHVNMRKAVAVKILHPNTEDFPDLVSRFEREAVVGAHLEHPNIAWASDMGTFGQGSYFLVLEYVPGQTLRSLLDAEGPLTPARAATLARQIATALKAAHDRGVIHRDLKPLNLMVTPGPDEQAKLIDFGLARVPLSELAPVAGEGELDRLSHPDEVFGTVDYMAPEIRNGMSAIDARSDLYSLGVMLYEMLAGAHPFDPCPPLEMLEHHRATEPPSMRARNPKVNVPPVLEAIVSRLLMKDPASRYADADALIEALDAGGVPFTESTSTRAVSRAVLPPPRLKKNLLPLVVGIVAVLAVVGIVAAIVGTRKAPLVETPRAAAVATEIPSPTAAPTARDLAAELAADLVKAEETADYREAAAVLVALADANPDALADPKIAASATQVAIGIGERGGPDATQAFYALSYRFGTRGLDVLWDVAVQKGGAKAASRARAILEVQAASNRPSKALRIAIELRRTACRQKPLLFSRAVKDGDARALSELQNLRPPKCEPDTEVCCFRRHLGLEKAIASLEERFP